MRVHGGFAVGAKRWGLCKAGCAVGARRVRGRHGGFAVGAVRATLGQVDGQTMTVTTPMQRLVFERV
jgi:hypothetical protein